MAQQNLSSDSPFENELTMCVLLYAKLLEVCLWEVANYKIVGSEKKWSDSGKKSLVKTCLL